MFFVIRLEKKEVCYYGGVASVRLIPDHGVTVHYNYYYFFFYIPKVGAGEVCCVLPIQ